MTAPFVRPLFARLVCSMLVVCMTVLPFNAQAGLIGTVEALAAGQAQSARDRVNSLVSRADVAAQLQAFGVPALEAAARVDALSDAEVAVLAGRIDALPAGANSVLAVVVIVLLIYFLVMHGGSSAKEPAKPAATK
jgi:hypothetical protein